MSKKLTVRVFAVLAIAACLGAVLMVPFGSRAEAEVAAAPQSPGDAWLHLYDPATSAFVFTLTLPTASAAVWDVAVAPSGAASEVWLTEPGLDRLGRLVYTDTMTYAFREYALPHGSHPLNLEMGNSYVWFTEPGSNSIGRIDRSSGDVAHFEVPTAQSYPADLDIAPDGSVWFTEMYADQIAHLVVTSTLDYDFTEYQGPGMGTGRPYGIVVVGDFVYFARMVHDSVTRFEVATDSWVPIRLPFDPPVPNEPYRLAVGSDGAVWGTERSGNSISQFQYQTIPMPTPNYVEPDLSQPSSLALGPGGCLWFTQAAVGQIGEFCPDTKLFSYDVVPNHGSLVTGITSDLSKGIWVLAYAPYQLHIPIVLSNGVSIQ